MLDYKASACDGHPPQDDGTPGSEAGDASTARPFRRCPATVTTPHRGVQARPTPPRLTTSALVGRAIRLGRGGVEPPAFRRSRLPFPPSRKEAPCETPLLIAAVLGTAACTAALAAAVPSPQQCPARGPVCAAAGSVSAAASAAAPPAAAAAGFPVTLTAANGAVIIKSDPARIVSLRPDRHRGPVRGGRGQAGRRRRPGFRLPGRARRRRACPASPRTSRRSRSTTRPGHRLAGLQRPCRRAEEARRSGADRARRRHPGRRLRPDRPARPGHRPRRPGGQPRGQHEERDRGGRKQAGPAHTS